MLARAVVVLRDACVLTCPVLDSIVLAEDFVIPSGFECLIASIVCISCCGDVGLGGLTFDFEF